jgi:hypothetical protein
MVVNLLLSISVVTSSLGLIVLGQIVVMFTSAKEKCFTILLFAKLAPLCCSSKSNLLDSFSNVGS